MKRFIGIVLLVCVLAGTMVTPVVADDRPEIDGLSDDFGFNGMYVDGVFDKYMSIHDLGYLRNIRPGSTYFIPLTRKDFDWLDDKEGTVTRNTIEQLGIEIYVEDTKGNNLIKSVKIDEQHGYMGLYISFVDTLKSVDFEEFDAEITLTVHGSYYRGATIRVQGTLANRIVSVKHYDTKCTLGPDRYAVGYDSVQNVKFHLGEGLSITSNIDFTDKYYGYARVKTALTEADKAAQAKYPQIVKVLDVYTLGFGGMVTFDLVENGPLYVYDDTLVYLGTTDNPVAYRETYYLASSKLA